MKICFLSHINNYHTKKWCKYFVDIGYDVHVISFEEGNIEGVTTHLVDVNVNKNGSDFQKIKYMLSGKQIKQIIKRINPDIVNVHFATSYGIAAALSGIDDYFLSVWGYDIYDFPRKSILHRILLKYSLKKATNILSTSTAMAIETNKYTDKRIRITPFGVDTNVFRPLNNNKEKEKIVIGSIKSLHYKYGMSYLIKAFKIVSDKALCDIELRIAGKGPEESNLKNLANELGISNKIKWLGFIDESEVVRQLNEFDIAIVPSVFYESFGVSAVEAEACEVPVIVTNVGGLKESTKENVTSLVVRPKDEIGMSNAIEKLINDKKLRKSMGKNGREYVKKNFELKNNFRDVEKIFLNNLRNK